ncbi:MAG: leucyl aminopeptidase [Armatimonadetes bacterium]|nr:leucyl aminopeptidase [Armatimonadota bacterium]
MEFRAVHGSLVEQPCDVLVVNLFEGVTEPGGATGAVDKALDGLISLTIREEEFEGRLGQTLVIRTRDQIPASKVLVVGLGKQDEFGTTEIMRASGAAARKCIDLRAHKVTSVLHGAGVAGIHPRESARAVALGTILGTYQHTRLKTENIKPNMIDTFEIVELSAEKLDHITQGIRRAEIVGNAVTFARDLVNEPSNVVTPSYLSSVAEEIARENSLECRVLDRQGIEEAGMELLAAVARGSAQEPRFVELKYKTSDNLKTIALIGKGITFDSGGYSLKSQDQMYGMKDDMAGAAAVLAAMRALAQIKPSVNVIALVPATENAIGGGAIHPGDVFTSLSGKTVEVVNTDAEGRLILADAVAYAVKSGSDEIIDVATLTGACVTALGVEISGILGNDQVLVDKLIKAGESCGEKLWQLPLHRNYRKMLDSDIADLKNVAGREAGAIIGALFIESFTNNTPWAHIDLSSATIDKDNELARKGATGIPTGTLIEYIASEVEKGRE